MEELSRLEMLIGEGSVKKLQSKKVIVFGIGGVGGYVCEALARCGVGRLDLVDSDTVSRSNINRQIIALHSTIGQKKVEVMKNRINDINPEIVVNAYDLFFSKESSNKIDFAEYDYVVDCIDTVSAKLEICVLCDKIGTPIISSMGTGNKLNPTMFKVADIYKTSVCPLARVMRGELKKRGIKKLKVVYSEETPVKLDTEEKRVPASSAFTPSVAGLIIASEVVKDLIE